MALVLLFGLLFEKAVQLKSLLNRNRSLYYGFFIERLHQQRKEILTVTPTGLSTTVMEKWCIHCVAKFAQRKKTELPLRKTFHTHL